MKFIIPITKGVIRDQHSRRMAMFVIVIVALLTLFAGATFLSGWLSENPLIFLGYWAGCAWLTLCSVLLAVYDLIVTRAEARRERRKLKRDIFGGHDHGGQGKGGE